MAHFAKLNEDNIVIAVNVVNNNVLDPDNEEQSGIDFLTEWSGGYSNWKQTSYNKNIRYNYAGIGYQYDSINDAFIPPKPDCGHVEIILNTNTYRWECDNEEHVFVL
jgi:hypothetical protein